MMNKHTVVIVWSDEDESFIGLCPEFPGLSAIGTTRAEAFVTTEQLIEAFREICIVDDLEMPEPTSIPGYQGDVSLQWSKLQQADAKAA